MNFLLKIDKNNIWMSLQYLSPDDESMEPSTITLRLNLKILNTLQVRNIFSSATKCWWQYYKVFNSDGYWIK